MAGAPLGRIEVEFTPGVWTNVTAYQLPGAITITTGRTDAGERMLPGRMTGLRLDNTDGRFTVGNASSPYWPNVTSGKQVRVSLKDPASIFWYPRFTGRVEGWPLSWADNGATCVVSLSAVDALNDWAVADMPGDFMVRATDALNPLLTTATLVGYWACTSVRADGAMPPSRGGAALVNSGTAPTSLSVDTFPGDGGTAFPFTWSTTPSGYYWGAAPPITSNSWGVSAWFRLSAEAAVSYPLIIEKPPIATSDRVWIRVKPDGTYLTTVTPAGVATDRIGPIGPAVTDDSWHQVILRVHESAGVVTASLYVDNVGVSGVTAGLTTTNMLADQSARLIRIGTGMTGSVAHVALWSGVDTATNQARAMPAAGLNSNHPGNRLQDIANLAGVPFFASVFPPYRAYLGGSSPFGKALDLARLVEDTDGGVLWCSTSGAVIYLDGARRTPQLALTLTGDDISGLQMAADRATLANDVTVTNTSPLSYFRPDPTVTQVNAYDAASVGDVGRRPASLSTGWYDALGDPGYLETRAGELMQTREAPRIPALTVDALTLPTAQQTALIAAASVWDVIAVTGLPTAGGTPSVWLGRIEGWTEVIDVDAWQVTFATSFAGSRVGSSTFAVVGSARVS